MIRRQIIPIFSLALRVLSAAWRFLDADNTLGDDLHADPSTNR